jgi:hypothetical protein
MLITICGETSFFLSCCLSVITLTCSLQTCRPTLWTETLQRITTVLYCDCYGSNDRGVVLRVPVVKNFRFSISLKPALGQNQPPIQWIVELLPRGYSGRVVTLTTRLQLVPRSGKRGSIHPLRHTSSWRSAELARVKQNVIVHKTQVHPSSDMMKFLGRTSMSIMWSEWRIITSIIRE